MSRTKQVLVTVSFILFITNVTFADWREDAQAIDISGGEHHTLVLTKNRWPWGCGPNAWYQLGIGATTESQDALVRVHKGDMNSTSDFLEDINDVDAGWKHSLALESYDIDDPNYNGYVWAWGNNEEGQLGDEQKSGYESPAPVQVLRGAQAPADPGNPDPNLSRIVDISAGRSGEHSLAADANGYAYGWGYNRYGQCGNGESGDGVQELTPEIVDQGDQPADPYDSNDCLKHIIAVSAGQTHSVALEAIDAGDPNHDGEVYAFGSNKWPVDGEGTYTPGSGKLGNGTEVVDSNTPVRVRCGEQDANVPSQVYLKYIVDISAGWDHSMALEKDDPNDPNHLNGQVYTWGSNGNGWDSGGGRLGNGRAEDANDTPVIVVSGEQYEDDANHPYLEHIIAVSAGEGHSMALERYDPCDPNLNGRVYLG